MVEIILNISIIFYIFKIIHKFRLLFEQLSYDFSILALVKISVS